MIGGRSGLVAVLAGLTALGGCANGLSGLYGSAATEAETPQLASGAPVPAAPTKVNMDPDAECPQINVPSGMSSFAAYAGAPGPSTVRYQVSVAQFARQCVLNADNTVTIRVGIEGLAVLGEKGSPGTFQAPLRIWVRDRETTVIASKSNRLSVTIPPGETQGNFKIVEESLIVPISLDKPLHTYEILVGFDAAGGGKPAKKKKGA